MDRQDLELVRAIQQHRSLTGAATALGVATPAVSKRLAALESRLQHPLFIRTTRQVSPTAEGELLCERAAALLAQFEALEAELLERRHHPTGVIRLAASLGFGRLWLGPAVADFQRLHPAVQIELTLTERLPDLDREGLDGAIWLWTPHEQRAAGWITRRLASNQRVLAAAPAYLRQHGHPCVPEDLAQHDCLVTQENGAGEPTSQGGRNAYNRWPLTRANDPTVVRVLVQGPLASNSGELVRDWCLAGHGIMLRSLWDIAPQLARGELVRVLPDYGVDDADVHWLMPRQPRTPRRVRLLIDFLAARFQPPPWQLTAPRAAAAPPG